MERAGGTRTEELVHHDIVKEAGENRLDKRRNVGCSTPPALHLAQTLKSDTVALGYRLDDADHGSDLGIAIQVSRPNADRPYVIAYVGTAPLQLSAGASEWSARRGRRREALEQTDASHRTSCTLSGERSDDSAILHGVCPPLRCGGGGGLTCR